MINRTFKFSGIAIALTGNVHVTATFNGEQVHSGPVPTHPFGYEVNNDLEDLFEYTHSIDLVGQVPLILTVTGGTLFFGSVDANYSGVEIETDNSNPEAPVYTVVTPPEEYWGQVFWPTPESDGKTNVHMDGNKMHRDLEMFPEATGSWTYQIPNGSTFTCDIFIDPQRVFTFPPPPTETDTPTE
jgi:hypothetical protein